MMFKLFKILPDNKVDMFLFYLQKVDSNTSNSEEALLPPNIAHLHL